MMNIFGFNIGGKTTPDIEDKLKTSTQHVKRDVENAITQRQVYESFQDLQTLRNALDVANSYGNYNREELHDIYRKIWRDTHLQSQWNTRKLKTKAREFKIVDIADPTNEDFKLTELLESGWFYEFVDIALDSFMWGFSLVQFGEWKNGTFNDFVNKEGEKKDAVYAVNRDYVKPEFGCIVQTPSAIDGTDYMNPNFWTLFVGRSHDLGLLEKLAALILIKENARDNWSEWAEVFAQDVRIARTNKTGSARGELLTALKNLASNGVGVFAPTDNLEFVGTSRSDAYKVYNELIRYVDEQISKVIFGQDVVSNNTGQVVGKTGENIAKLYGNTDARFIKAVVNDKLLPFLTKIGAGNFEGKKFVFDTSEELTLAERADIDLKISQMGKQHSDEYINEVYGVEVETQTDNAPEIANKIKDLYKNVR